MSGYKSGRMAEDLKREISLMIRELKDPRINKTMLSIVKMDVAGDGSFAKIYISSFSGMEAAKEAVKGLESASGLMKRELSNRMHLKKAPELKFIADDSIEHSTQINRLLEELK